jgi:peptide/nickel transport system permease protein
MSTTATAEVSGAQPIAHPAVSRGYVERSILRFRRDPTSMAALVGFIFVVILSYGSPLIADHVLHTSPTDQNLLDSLTPWFTVGHLLGTDELGRDVLTRALYAGQISLGFGFAVAFFSLAIGVAMGLIAGYYGGWVDDAINALLQIIRGIPTLYLLVTLSVLFRPDPLTLALIFGVLGWTGTCRQVRGLVFSVKQRDYVDAARVLGVPVRRILLRHILPNVSSIVLVIAGFDVGGAIIGESGLSFLGLGIQPPTASWGNMLSGALDNITRAPWLIVAPGLFITFTVLCIFLLADGLRDALDPRLKE